MFTKPWIWLTVLIGLLGVLCATFMHIASPVPFAYDESDYMYAGTQGAWANYIDRGSMSLVEFIAKGRELSRDTSRRVSMSAYVRSTGDLSFYRHYHGPLYAYWIALWKALGTHSEAVYRGSGMILHALGALAIFWLFLKAFPELPAAGAFVAAVLFAVNRSAIVTGTLITQHIVFEVLAFVSLLTMAVYCRTHLARWWYATAVLLALAFAAVEISCVLIAAVVLALLVNRLLNPEWRSHIKETLMLMGKGTLWFLGTLVLVWPKGLLELNVVKGYLYLAYIAIYRKTFSPIGPQELWEFKVKTYPFEFVLALLTLLLVIVFWRKLRVRAAVLPVLIYAVMFLGVTMVVTVTYVYYHGSLLAALAILTGVAFGELWNRTGPVIRTAALAVILLSAGMELRGCYQDLAVAYDKPSFAREVLTYLDHNPTNGRLFVSYVLVPPLHYYRPETVTVGYDQDWTAQRLADESMAGAPSKILCVGSIREAVTGLLPPSVVMGGSDVAGHTDETGEPVYTLTVQPK
jgi:hypothetical protein